MVTEIDDYSNSPSARRVANPIGDAAAQKKKHKKHHDPRHNVAFFQGFRDVDGYAIEDNDYYGILGSMGFYDNSKLPFGSPLTHSTDVTTALQLYNTSLKKTPIDTREEVKKLDSSKVAKDLKSGQFYTTQNFRELAAERISEKTHRILTDPIRTFQSQTLIDIQNHLNLLRNKKDVAVSEKIMEFSSMNITVNMLLLERITDLLDTAEKQLLFDKDESRPQGKTFYAEMTLSNGAQATKIDFRNPANSRNIPSTSVISGMPNQNLYFLDLIFDTGTNLHFMTNEPANSLETSAKLINPPQSIAIAPSKLTIESINVRASGADGTIRMIGLY